MAIASWLIPLGPWQVRVHHLRTDRALDSAEGGFALRSNAAARVAARGRGCRVDADNGFSLIEDIGAGTPRRPDHIVTPPNSSIMFADCALIPTLTARLAPGEHWLYCAVYASPHSPPPHQPPVAIRGDGCLRLIDPRQDQIVVLTL